MATVTGMVPPGLSIDDAPAVREGETAEFVVRLSAASGAAVTDRIRHVDGTAVAGVDYTSTSGTLRFDAGETRTTLAVPTLEDATAEETEGFTVQLSEPAGRRSRTGQPRERSPTTMSPRGCRLTMRRRCAKAKRQNSSCG